ncbi:MAG: DUF4426 domain-containing protein [Kistimonas sp.]|nr:DUF4426 domain-containing protein [Kistimonas sp.]
MDTGFLFGWRCRSIILTSLALLAVTMGSPALAYEKKFGDILVHYSTFDTAFLSPEIAARYGIERSSRKGCINLAVHKNDKPQRAQITITRSNLMGQRKTLKPRLIEEGDAIYYLVFLDITPGELFKFDLSITPEKSQTSHQFKFNQKF